jgi:RHS repeat-associated protein
VKEAGYAFVYVSNENAAQTDVYFDDVKITYTPTNVIQYNEYYPFGLQANSSWTRDNSKNNYLYNEGSELNANSGWYEMTYRGYDPAIGRMNQADPMAAKYHDHSSYNSR